MHAGIDIFGALEDLIHVEVLLGVVHHLQDYAPLAGQPDATFPKRFRQVSGGFWSIDALAGRRAMRWRGCHRISFIPASKLEPRANAHEPAQDRDVIIRATSLYI